jgi:hypothetical protein
LILFDSFNKFSPVINTAQFYSGNPRKAVKRCYISNNTWNIIKSDPELKSHYTHVLRKITELTPGEYSKDSLINILKKDLPNGPVDDINAVTLFDYIE